jgi:hypothetical protein
VSVIGLRNVPRRCRFGAVAALLSLGVCSVGHAGAGSLASPSMPSEPIASMELAQLQTDPSQERHSLRPLPTSSAELWSRWLELLRETGGRISKEQFEQVMGIALPELRQGSDGLVQHILSIREERFLIAVFSSRPERSYASATIEWRPNTFGSGRVHCLEAQVAKDLAQLGWQEEPRRHHSQFWTAFRNGVALATYRSSANACAISVQTCVYDPLYSPLCNP